MNKILIIDNYDSFTYNLVQYFGVLDCDVVVKRNDEITIREIEALGPERICISPGPGRPENAGISNEVCASSARRLRFSASGSSLHASAVGLAGGLARVGVWWM